MHCKKIFMLKFYRYIFRKNAEQYIDSTVKIKSLYRITEIQPKGTVNNYYDNG